jgi:thiamine pyrophosphate-dependent acetolactate synthase large subunit-like protein
MTLRHSDYAAMARGLSAHGERVESDADHAPTLRRALANALPSSTSSPPRMPSRRTL